MVTERSSDKSCGIGATATGPKEQNGPGRIWSRVTGSWKRKQRKDQEEGVNVSCKSRTEWGEKKGCRVRLGWKQDSLGYQGAL